MRILRVLVAALVLPAAAACSSDDDRRSPGSGEAACAAALEYDGHDYTGHGELKRHPETIGSLGSGTFPGCDDGGGASGPEEVEVLELEALPPQRAVLVGDTVFLRDGKPFPEQIRPWFESPGCAADEAFELTGTWLGVTGPRKVRFDGDLRPPFRVEVDVHSGPDDYAGTVLVVHATEDTDPTLGPEDVKTSLWEGGDVTAVVECDGDRFVALSLTSTPG